MWYDIPVGRPVTGLPNFSFGGQLRVGCPERIGSAWGCTLLLLSGEIVRQYLKLGEHFGK